MGGRQIFCFVKKFVEFSCKAKKDLRAGSHCGGERKEKSIFNKISQVKQLLLAEKWKFFH